MVTRIKNIQKIQKMNLFRFLKYFQWKCFIIFNQTYFQLCILFLWNWK